MRYKNVILLVLAMVICLSGCDKKDYDAKDYVTLGQYKGIEVANIEFEVTQEDIDAGLEKLISEHTVYAYVERPVQVYDFVNIDLQAVINGEDIAGLTTTGYEVPIGFGSYVMDGFAECLIGLEPGKTHEVSMTVPDTFTEPEYIGYEVIFNVTINNVRGQVRPELTDEFIKSVTDSQTLDEYLEELNLVLYEEKKAATEQQIKTNAWRKVVEMAECSKYPKGLVEEKTEEMDKQFELHAMFENNISTDEYAKKYYGMSLDELAKEQVKQRLIFEVIAEKEKIKISDSEYKEKLPEFAKRMNNGDAENFESSFGKEVIKERMLWDKIQQFVYENAIVK